MRIGENPNNHKKLNFKNTGHRVIIPVYIPNNEGYFKESLAVFKICIESLIATINKDTAISIISNGSSNEVNLFIAALLDNGKINRAIFNSENVGKVNAIMAETRASFEEFITYSDSDVFFDKGWLKQTFDMFNNIPKAGFVSMNPIINNFSSSKSTLLANIPTLLFKRKKVSDVCGYKDLQHFHKSIGQAKSYTERIFNTETFCVGGTNNYIIGAGHFCCTIRKTPTLKFVPTTRFFGAFKGAEEHYLDTPFDKTGLWKLSSPKAFVWHMGNSVEEDWTQKKMEALNDFFEEDFSFSTLSFKNVTITSIIFPYKMKSAFVRLLKLFKILKSF